MFKLILTIIAGIVSLVFSIIGFLVPIIPGWPFLLLAIILIAPKRGKKLAKYIKQKTKLKKKSQS